MKYLGIDYGSKRIGLSVSDKDGNFAFPNEVLLNKGLRASVEAVAEIIKKDDIGAVVVGHSANFRGQDNPIMRNVRQFIDSLKREIDLPIHLEPEFMTSVQAARITGKDKNLDAQAAAIILQSFLDKKES
jgi:putative Holliday junction resolvase